ncbi:MAG: translesion DNA synthesis-associated protein ImuA [Burkholderiales bacterium]|nr:translesion DNA synthesis-associated protein ImuA [Burkholderiales bacterium]
MGQAPSPAIAVDPDAGLDTGLDSGRGLLWRGSDLAHVRPGFATGFASLDAELPGGGWPAGALTEVLHHAAGIGELRLFFPALAQLTRAGSPVFLLAPPWRPYAPAFASAGIALPLITVVRPARPQEALWAGEQILKTLSDGALLAWPQMLKPQDARRLQLAAEGKPVLAVLMRPAASAGQATPAALRVALDAIPGQLRLRILKRRGGTLARPIALVPPGVPATPATVPPSPTAPALSSHRTPPDLHVVDRDTLKRPDARRDRLGTHA